MKMEMPDEIYVHEQLKNYKMFQNIFFETKGSDKYYHSRVVEALKAENKRFESNFNVLEQKLKDYSKAIDRLLAENEALKAELAKRQWKPIESAPIDGCMWIMLGHKDYGVSEIGYFNKRHNVWCSGTDRTLFMPHGPTHWMPLPDAPEVKE